ncbi:MAG: hypothetical protein JJ934_00110 [Pseudomonadales bacterium]|nr:hypothetical protein [Pseudomonadales bacterium]MBO6597236.1 hypothetical protein [Pseudomonadales bacterium]MBO6655258.1 hypothetical protein [Pseudomonadales bacterium]MBO6703865.1 hypothetical protein [Pseudomonadales bacterium]MBO6823578.1 hypothetical protein [Pseudomonadales bacterium]
MSIPIHEVLKLKYVEKVILHCHDQSLYLVSVIIDGEETYVTNKKGEFLKSFNKLDLQTQFSKLLVGEMVVRHKSPYDEMIGMPDTGTDNTLEVRIGGEAYASGQGEKLH